MNGQDELSRSMERLTLLIERVELSASPEALEPAREVARAVLEVHAAGLRALLEVVAKHSPEARGAIERDPGLLGFLAMHDLCEHPLPERIDVALTTANDALAAQARATVSAIDGEHVRIAIEGREHPARELMQRTLERLLSEHAPDAIVEFTGLGTARPPSLIPVSRLVAARS
jgi:hypothetical protein